MKRIQLNRLTLINFKGIRDLTIDFDPAITTIAGYNRTGKTTLNDGFLWLFFGKDSTDRKDFSIKTLDANNEPIHRLQHSVEGHITVDNVLHRFRKEYAEKWTKKRGSHTEEFTGHETTYFWNDVPMKAEEYTKKVSEIFDESIFKLITSTTYFNSLKWQERRSVLLNMAGEIKDTDVISKLEQTPAIEELIKALNEGKTMEEYRKQVIARRLKIKEELDLIPSKIREANLAMPEPEDYDTLTKEKEGIEAQIAQLDTTLQSAGSAERAYDEEITKLSRQKQELIRKQAEIEGDIKAKVFENKNKVQKDFDTRKKQLAEIENDITIKQGEIVTKENQIATQNTLRDTKREQWNTENAKELEVQQGDFLCPTCHTPLSPDDVAAKLAEMHTSFNTTKENKLRTIADEGKAIADKITECTNKITDLQNEIEQLNTDKNNILFVQNSTIIETDEELNERVKEELANDLTYQSNKIDIDELTTKIATPFQKQDNREIQAQKKQAQADLNAVITKLASKETRERQQKRVQELLSQEETLAEEMASREGVENAILQVSKAKMDEVEGRINSMFKIVKFKMFNTLINGGEEETCITLINGVPYADANTASKIQGGIDIINALSNYYGVTAPIWIDNRESVIDIPDTASQIINLRADANYPTLTVLT